MNDTNKVAAAEETAVAEALGAVGRELAEAGALGKFLLDVRSAMAGGQSFGPAVSRALSLAPKRVNGVLGCVLEDVRRVGPAETWGASETARVLKPLAVWALLQANAVEKAAASLGRAAEQARGASQPVIEN